MLTVALVPMIATNASSAPFNRLPTRLVETGKFVDCVNPTTNAWPELFTATLLAPSELVPPR